MPKSMYSKMMKGKKKMGKAMKGAEPVATVVVMKKKPRKGKRK